MPTKPTEPTAPAATTPSPTRRGRWRNLAVLAIVVVAAGVLAEGAKAWVQHQRAAALRAVAKPGDIHMISQTTCIYCTQARQWLTKYDIPFEECFIEQDAACLAEYNRQGRNGTPMMLVRGQMQRGFDAQRITRQLADAAPPNAH